MAVLIQLVLGGGEDWKQLESALAAGNLTAAKALYQRIGGEPLAAVAPAEAARPDAARPDAGAPPDSPPEVVVVSAGNGPYGAKVLAVLLRAQHMLKKENIPARFVAYDLGGGMGSCHGKSAAAWAKFGIEHRRFEYARYPSHVRNIHCFAWKAIIVRSPRGGRGPRRGYSVETSRGTAAAATWILRGDKSRRRRGCHVNLPWRRVATPRLRRGYSVETSRGTAAAATWISPWKRVAATPRPRRG